MIADVALYVVMPILVIALCIALVRLIRGPFLPDRVIALDLMSSIGIAIIAVYAIGRDEPILLDIALVLALLAFLGTVAFALFMERYR